MKRREFMTLLGAAAGAWPVAARAQRLERMRRIGLLSPVAEDDQDFHTSLSALRLGLQKLGWIEGSNVEISYRWAAGDVERLRAFAKVLDGMIPDVLFSSSTAASAAMRRETNSIPIVFVQVSDPIGEGCVASLARPGGCMSGLTNFEPAVRPIAMPLRDASEIEAAITAFARDSNGGLVVLPDVFANVHREPIIRLAAHHRLPAIYPFRFFVTDGGLISYGVDRHDVFRRGAAYVDRILRGAKPADLPVEAPTKFELVINLKTAKTLGLDVPLQLQQRADEVIE